MSARSIFSARFPPENVFTIRDTSITTLVVDTVKFLIWTRKNSIDTVLDLELFSRFTALLTGFSGAQRRVGFIVSIAKVFIAARC